MALYVPQRPPLQLRNALAGARPVSLLHSETSIGSDLGRLRRGVTSESFLDVAILPAGALYTSTRGRPVRRTSVVFDPNWGWRTESVLTVDAGTGSDVVIGAGMVSVQQAAINVAEAAPQQETAVKPSTVAAVEAPVTLTIPQPVSAGPTQLGDTGDEVVSDTSTLSNAEYGALLGGGGYGTPYGALGAAGAATYQTIDESVPVYDPYVAPVYSSGYYEPTYYQPPPVNYGTTPQPQTYEEWAQVQTDLEQIELLNQGGFAWNGPLV